MAKLFIFRHGQSTDNKEGVFSGKRDCDLTSEGLEEAKKIGEALKNEAATKAYQSDLIRSKHTLELVLNGYHQGVEIITDSRIRERDYGDLTGAKKEELEKKDPENYKLWHRSYEVPPPNGESIKDVEIRVLSFLADLKDQAKPDDVIFISAHGNSLRPMRRYFENMPIEEMVTFEHTPGKIYSYEL